MAALFPSAEWFNEVRDVFNNDERYHGAGGGACHCTSAMKVGKRVFLVTFEGEECAEITEADTVALDDVDFYLDMPLEDWREMVKDIAANGGASLDHTLNTLDLNRAEGLSHSTHEDQFREDLFFRYNQTFQFFFDASAQIKTRFK
jgi:hypothetical protein